MRKFLAVLLLSALCIKAQMNFGFEIQKFRAGDSLASFRGISVHGKEVWVSGSGGSVFRSDNGGKIFNKIEIPKSSSLDFRDIQKISKNKIVLMSSGSGESSKIFISGDNGKSWKCVYTNKYKDGFLDSFEFRDESSGIAMGDPVNGRLNILLTSDGGENWTEADTLNLPKTIPGEAAFAASGSCIATIENNYAWIATGGAAARIFRTSDKGKSWEVFDTPVISGQAGAGIFSVFFSDKESGIVVGGNYTDEKAGEKNAAVTNDGGKSWRLLPDGTLPYQSCVKKFISGGKKFFISAGPAGVFVSNDEWKWQKVGDEGYHCIGVSANGNAVWLAGSGGRIGRLINNQ